jgi:hypothetical protein
MTSSSAHQDKESFFVTFARDYGWRAYAIPVLAVITVWVLFDVFLRPTDSEPTAAQESIVQEESAGTNASGQALNAPQPADSNAPDIPLSELPPGGKFTQKGKGTYKPVGTAGAESGEGKKKTYTYVVEIEEGVDATAYGGGDAFAAMVDATLANPKGWTNDGKYKFVHVNADQDPDFRFQLTSLDTTHAACGHDLGMETSCFNSNGGRVVINESRWVRGAAPFEGDLGAYRQYLLNHELGHGLGFAAHTPCGENGALAPIMMQQTLSMSNDELYRIDPSEVYEKDGKICRPNPWPFPHA